MATRQKQMSLTQSQRRYIRKNYPSKKPGELAETLNISQKEVELYIEESGLEPDPARKRLFKAIAIALPFILFGLLEVGLRLGSYKGDTSLFVEVDVSGQTYLLPNPNFTARYFFYTNSLPSPSQDMFLKQKPANGFRVFVLGGSTAAGYPYGFNGTFSRVVRDALEDVMPNRIVEVVNVATSAINTYTLYDQVPEVLRQQPDAILIYTGHNEYYGALGVGSNEQIGAFPAFTRFFLKLQKMKTFLLARDFTVFVMKYVAGRSEQGPGDPTGTLMERIVRNQVIPLHSTTYEMGKHQFESNLKTIVNRFEKAEIPVFVGSLASNLKDQPPFISVESDTLPEAEHVYEAGKDAYERENFTEAALQFSYARDLDALKFRAPGSFNEIIRSITEQTSAIYVPVEERLMENSDHNIIGNVLMHEHLHPKHQGYWQMGMAYIDALKEQNFFGEASTPENLQSESHYFHRMRLTEFDRQIAYHRIRHLTSGWPFVQDERQPSYVETYRPESVADSLAFRVVHLNMEWERAKVELGEFYRDKNQPQKAVEEFFGLIRNQPWNDSPYLFAARIFLDYNDFNNAYPLLQQAYEIYPEDAFTLKMLGAIEIDNGNLERGINLLEESIRIKPDDAQALFNLSGGYGLTGQYEKAIRTAEQARQINPDFPGLRQWIQQLEATRN